MLTTNLIRLVLLRMTSIFEDLYAPGLHWTIPAVRASTNADFVEGPRKTVTRRGQHGLHFSPAHLCDVGVAVECSPSSDPTFQITNQQTQNTLFQHGLPAHMHL
jgi:hypothetical protein